jgi:ketosteroid isomerase-like protein
MAAETIDRFYKAMNDRRFDDMVELLDPGVVQEWPQSGESFRGRENIKAVLENYPDLPSPDLKRVVGAEDKWILTPSWTPLRISGTGDQFTSEAHLTYPNGERWHVVSIFEFRNGKILKMTQYFAAPFPAPDWRSKWAERMQSRGE